MRFLGGGRYEYTSTKRYALHAHYHHLFFHIEPYSTNLITIIDNLVQTFEALKPTGSVALILTVVPTLPDYETTSNAGKLTL